MSIKNLPVVVPVTVLFLLLAALPAQATSILSLDAAFGGPGSPTSPFDSIPVFRVTGTFTGEFAPSTNQFGQPGPFGGPITSWDLTFISKAGNSLHDVAPLVDEVTHIGTGTGSAFVLGGFWQFNLRDGNFSLQLITVFNTGGPLFTGEVLYLCASQLTYYATPPSPVFSQGCIANTIGGFGDVSGFPFSLQPNGLSSATVTVVSTPESSELLLFSIGCAGCFGLIWHRRKGR